MPSGGKDAHLAGATFDSSLGLIFSGTDVHIAKQAGAQVVHGESIVGQDVDQALLVYSNGIVDTYLLCVRVEAVDGKRLDMMGRSGAGRSGAEWTGGVEWGGTERADEPLAYLWSDRINNEAGSGVYLCAWHCCTVPGEDSS